MSRVVLRCRNLTKTYKVGDTVVRAVDGVSLEMKEGEMVLLLGPSGSGKSTLLHMVGLLDVPDSGKVEFQGHDGTTLSDAARSRIRLERIGFVFQFHHLLPELTVLQQVTAPGLVLRRLSRRECRRRAEELLERVSLLHRAHHRPSQISGGERQRAAVARALFNEPVLLLCDEPTGNLDSVSGGSVMEILSSLTREGSVAVLVASHNEGFAALADRVIVIRDGRLESP